MAITTVWSTTKTMTALCALVLADDRGQGNLAVRHLLGHTARAGQVVLAAYAGVTR
ncbi:hypothetical protein [Amycolatopsis australiensis]|uniref:hypothetical protein n=1 Tax=Amycolatopsis australiensis TaxID=546364 RepID=UPI001C432B40|nr:hypothetical protein [Amycolatopsis australiensis]